MAFGHGRVHSVQQTQRKRPSTQHPPRPSATRSFACAQDDKNNGTQDGKQVPIRRSLNAGVLSNHFQQEHLSRLSRQLSNCAFHQRTSLAWPY